MKKTLKTILLGLVLMTMPVVAHAYDCNMVERIDGLDPVSKRELIVKCEQTKLEAQQRAVKEVVKEATPTSTKVLDTMDRVSQIALQFAEAVGVAAKQLGVAVNEFITTPAGLMTIAFIIYQIAGSTITYIVLALLGLTFIVRTIRTFLNRIMIEGYEEKEVNTWYGKTKKVQVPIYTPWKKMGDGQVFWTLALPIIECVAVIVLLLNIPSI